MPPVQEKFLRLDTHLRNSATCRIPTLSSHMASLPSSQDDMTPPSLAEHQPAEIPATIPTESQTSSSHSSSPACGHTEHQVTGRSIIAHQFAPSTFPSSSYHRPQKSGYQQMRIICLSCLSSLILQHSR